MRVGLFLTNQHPVGSNMVAALDGQIAMVHRAREYGWDSVWAGHHYLTQTVSMLQPVPFLARLAPEAGDMTLGLGILLLALLNPVDVAETVASLDTVCRGRFIFGVGLGYRDAEYAACAIPRRQRLRRFEANLQAVQRLWTEDHVDIDLPWCSGRDITLALRPVQRPRPPLWIAADNDRAVERAARLGDTWLINPHAAMDTIRRQLSVFRATRQAWGLPPPSVLPAIKEVFCGPDRTRALAMAKPYLEQKYRTYAAWGQDRALPSGESFDLPFDRLAAHRFVIGSPDECLRQLLPWRDELGVNYLIIRTHWSEMPVEAALQSMELLSREVIPTLRQAA